MIANFPSQALRVSLAALLLAYPGLPGLRADGPVGTVVSGNAGFNYNGNTTTITAGDKTIIEYNRFNIAKDETVNFVQPSSTSRVLNRITGADPTSILGRLQANGIVYFVNPAGIYFGQNAIVDVGQLYAAAGSLSNSDFLARNDNFTRLSGQVFNEGAINASAIHLVGQNVRNTGALNSPAGLVMMAAGDDVLIGERGGHLFVNATIPETPDSGPATGAKKTAPGVENSGQINAQGGRALLAAGDLYAIAVQNSGIIRALDVELAGQGAGEVWNRGQIDASSATNSASAASSSEISNLKSEIHGAGTGGSVTVTGQYVGLDAGSLIDASGATAGGQILIGGDYQGANPAIRNATATYVAEGATIKADATDPAALNSTGGRVIVWADDTTRFHGDISARGNSIGGFAEVSGKQHLHYTGRADLRATAPNGKTGTLLLDPDNITISELSTSPQITGTNFFTLPAATDGDFNIFSGDLTSQLALSDVTVKTLTGDITVASSAYLNWNDPTTLTLDAGRDININQAIANFDTTDTAGLILKAARNITVATSITIEVPNITLTTLSGSSIINDGATLRVLGIDSPLTINGGLHVGTNATLQANNGGLLVNAGARDVTIATDIFVATATITNANNITIDTVDAYAGDLTFVGNGAITIGGLINANTGGTALGNITITSSNGAITATESALLQAPNSITLTARDDITIQGALGSTDWPNAALTLASTTGSSIFGAASFVSGRSLTLTGGVDFRAYLDDTDPAIRYGTALTIDAQNRDVTLARAFTGDAINVNNAANITLADTAGISASTLAITNAANITIGSLIDTTSAQTYTAARDISITGTLQTDYLPGNNITLTAQTGTVALAAGSAVLSGAAINITGGARIDAGAQVQTNGAPLDINAGGDRDITIATDIYTTALTATNAANITVTATNINAYGAITFIGNAAVILSGGLSTGSGADITVTSRTGTIAIAPSASLNSDNDILLTGGLNVATGATIAPGSTIIIDGLNRDISILADLAPADLAITNANNLTLANVITADAQTYTAASNITLTGTLQTQNSFAGVSLAASAGTVSIASTGAIDARGDIAINGGLNVATGVTLATTGTFTANALTRDVTIASDLAAASISITNASKITTASIIASAGDAILTANSDITLNGAVYAGSGGTRGIVITSSNGTITTAEGYNLGSGKIALNAHGDINLNGYIGTYEAATGDFSSASVTGSTIFGAHSALFVTSATITGGVDFKPYTGSNPYYAPVRTYNGLTIDAQGRDITLARDLSSQNIAATNATNITLSGSAISATNGEATFIGNAAVTISGGIDAGSGGAGNLNITSNTGTITVTADATLSAARNINLTGGLDIADGATINTGYFSGGDLTVNALTRDVAIRTTLTLPAGTVSITNARDITLASIFTPGDQTYAASRDFTLTGTLAGPWGPYVPAPGGNITLAAGRDLTLTETAQIESAGHITGTAGNTITIADNPDGWITGSTATLAATGDITIATFIMVDDTLSVTSQNGDITIPGMLDSSGLMTISAASGTTKILSTGNLWITGADLNITGGLDIAQDARINADAFNIDARNHDITLAGKIIVDATTVTNAANIALSGGILSGTQTYTAARDITIDGNLNATDINLTSQNGAITIHATATTFTVTNLTANAKTIDIQGALAPHSVRLFEATEYYYIDNLDFTADHISLGALETLGDQTYTITNNGALKLNGALTSGSGSIHMRSTGLDTLPAHATIFSTSPDGIVISATAGSFHMGALDTMLAYDNGNASPAAGSITITAGLSANLGNLSASKTISVNAPIIGLLGGVYQAPVINLAASDSIYSESINGAIIFATTSGAGPRLPGIVFKTIPADHLTADRAAMLSGTTFFPELPVTDATAPFASVYLNTEFWRDAPVITPGEEIKQNVIAQEMNAANEAIPQAEQQTQMRRVIDEAAYQEITAGTTISEATADMLRKLGIFPRPLTPAEREDLSAYFGVLQQEIPTEIRTPEMYRVASGRISEQSAQTAISAWLAAFTKTGDPALAQDTRVPDLQAALLKTYRAFRETQPDAPVANYTRHIATLTPADDTTLLVRGFLQDVRRLFDLIDNLGLTTNEALVSKNVILRPLRTQGLPANLLQGIIHAAPEQPPLDNATPISLTRY